MILDSLDDLNRSAVGASLATAFTIGVVWFSPSVPGGFWARRVARYTGLPEAEITAAAAQPQSLAKWLVGLAVAAVAMAMSAEAMGADSAGDGVVLGIVLAVGLGATLSSRRSVPHGDGWGRPVARSLHRCAAETARYSPELARKSPESLTGFRATHPRHARETEVPANAHGRPSG